MGRRGGGGKKGEKAETRGYNKLDKGLETGREKQRQLCFKWLDLLFKATHIIVLICTITFYIYRLQNFHANYHYSHYT